MKVVILAGGLGTRISEYTKFIPKPMIKIGKFPILIHIMRHYLKYGLNEFIVAAGYKAEILKKYFPKFKKYGLNFEHKRQILQTYYKTIFLHDFFLQFH